MPQPRRYKPCFSGLGSTDLSDATAPLTSFLGKNYEINTDAEATEVRADGAGGGTARLDPLPRPHRHLRHVRLLGVPHPPRHPPHHLRQAPHGDRSQHQGQTDGRYLRRFYVKCTIR